MLQEVAADEILNWAMLPRTELIDRLGSVVAELFSAYQEAALVEAEERKQKTFAFRRSDSTGVTSRDRDAAAQALPATMQLIELRGRIASLESAREYGYLLLSMVT